MQKMIIALMLLAAVCRAEEGLLAGWDFYGKGGNSTTTTNASYASANLSSVPAWSAGTLTVNSRTNAWAFTAWNTAGGDLAAAISSNDYFQMSLAVSNGVTLKVTNITMRLFGNNANAADAYILMYSFSPFGDGTTAAGAVTNAPWTTTWLGSSSLSTNAQEFASAQVSGGTLYFRLYGYSAGASTASGFAGSDTAVSGPGNNAGINGTYYDVGVYGSITAGELPPPPGTCVIIR